MLTRTHTPPKRWNAFQIFLNTQEVVKEKQKKKHSKFFKSLYFNIKLCFTIRQVMKKHFKFQSNISEMCCKGNFSLEIRASLIWNSIPITTTFKPPVGFLQGCTSLKPGLCCYRGKLNCLERDTLVLHSQCWSGKAGPGNKAQIMIYVSSWTVATTCLYVRKTIRFGPWDGEGPYQIDFSISEKKIEAAQYALFIQNMKKRIKFKIYSNWGRKKWLLICNLAVILPSPPLFLSSSDRAFPPECTAQTAELLCVATVEQNWHDWKKINPRRGFKIGGIKGPGLKVKWGRTNRGKQADSGKTKPNLRRREMSANWVLMSNYILRCFQRIIVN